MATAGSGCAGSMTSRVVPIDGSDGAHRPFWSPDGRSIAFFAHNRLKRIAEAGGLPQDICEVGWGEGSGTWSREGVILFGAFGQSLSRVAETGGVPTPATALDPSRQQYRHSWPVFLPDGRRFLFLAQSNDPAETAVYQGTLGSTETRRAFAAVSRVAVAGSHVLTLSKGLLIAQPYDAERVQVGAVATTIAEHVDSDTTQRSGGALSAAAGGVVAFRSASPDSRLIWFDRTGKRDRRIPGAGRLPSPLAVAGREAGWRGKDRPGDRKARGLDPRSCRAAHRPGCFSIRPAPTARSGRPMEPVSDKADWRGKDRPGDRTHGSGSSIWRAARRPGCSSMRPALTGRSGRPMEPVSGLDRTAWVASTCTRLRQTAAAGRDWCSVRRRAAWKSPIGRSTDDFSCTKSSAGERTTFVPCRSRLLENRRAFSKRRRRRSMGCSLRTSAGSPTHRTNPARRKCMFERFLTPARDGRSRCAAAPSPLAPGREGTLLSRARRPADGGVGQRHAGRNRDRPAAPAVRHRHQRRASSIAAINTW